ncbi:hypothetical protein [Raineyella sp.]|uniref:hypothetical protein n=1 Tax=Raineyella sp. TaxID=1911550 RepID=UPI002B2183D1|nr:hypothetical protein [Raineyella sp.]MEA5153905.1 PqqD family peptide modification chaperone [Raineyella sp.]
MTPTEPSDVRAGVEPMDVLVSVEPVDVLELDDGALLLFERTVVRLSELGRTVVDLCRQPHSEAEIAGHLVDIFGTPPDGDLAEATACVIRDLLSDGVLRRLPPTGWVPRAG